MRLLHAPQPENLTMTSSSLMAQALQLERHSDDTGAMTLYRRILEADPGHLGAVNNLSLLLMAHGQLFAAAKLCRTALPLNPDSLELVNTMAAIELKRGQTEAYITLLQDTWNRHPEHLITGSNLMLALNYQELPPETLWEEHCRWGRLCDEHSAIPAATPILPATLGRRLRVGYVSADFRRHSVAFFIEALFHFHDREKIELHLFSDVASPDYVTTRIRSQADAWHDLSEMDNVTASAYIRQQQVDILVDLAGHTGRRMEIFARRAAPIQISWLGYPNTTGVNAMDWRLTDDLADPPEFDRFYTERQYRLPGGMWTYSPPENISAPVPPPCLERGYLTFGSFNHIAKISTATERLWAAVLRAVPNSRLLLKNGAFADPDVVSSIHDRFARCGVDPKRIETRPFNPVLQDHFREYHDIDLALDTWPYNGTTTTFESLWMGVPVLSMSGTTHASRTGSAIMGRLGLNSFIASSRRELIGKAVTLASSPELLAQLRKQLRPLLAASSLCDGRRLAAEMEVFFHSISTAAQ